MTGKASYLLPDVPMMSRVTLVMNPEGEMYGLMEGTYTKYVLKKAVASGRMEINGRDDFDFLYYGFGKTFFSTYDSENMLETRVKSPKAVLDVETAQLMKNSDAAIYASEPKMSFGALGVTSEKMRLVFITVKTGILNLSVTMDSSGDAESFFRLLKNHYYTFKAKSGASQAEILGIIDATFSRAGSTVSISALEDEEYIEFWKQMFMESGSINMPLEETSQTDAESGT